MQILLDFGRFQPATLDFPVLQDTPRSPPGLCGFRPATLDYNRLLPAHPDLDLCYHIQPLSYAYASYCTHQGPCVPVDLVPGPLRYRVRLLARLFIGERVPALTCNPSYPTILFPEPFGPESGLQLAYTGSFTHK